MATADTRSTPIRRMLASATRVFGEQSLCNELGVGKEQLHAWLDGREEPPWPIWDRLVELILDRQKRTIRRARDHLDASRSGRKR